MNTSSDCRMACENIIVTLVYSNSAKWLWWNDYKVCKAKHFSNTEKKKNQNDVEVHMKPLIIFTIRQKMY